VVGSGPNGLAAAITLAREGRSVLVLEAAGTIGGGTRSRELTLPGFVHDVCAAIHPLGVASPFFRSLPLADHGLEWVVPPAGVAHPFDDGTAVLLEPSVEATAARMGEDAQAWAQAVRPFLKDPPGLVADLLTPLGSVPRHPLLTLRFGLAGLRSARGVAEALFRGPKARGFFAGLAAHSVLPMESLFTGSFGFMFALLGHGWGWPLARGGSQKIADAMASYLRSLGGEITTGRPVRHIDELPAARAVFFDVTPRQLLRIAGDRLSGRYRRALERYRYGAAAYKLDLALSGPIPWTAKECAQAATVHLGASLDEISVSERAMDAGLVADRPYVIVAQQSLFDATRAPAGRHTLWAYCHVPHGFTGDVTERIEAQIDRFAPGWRDLILARHVTPPAALETYNENYVGGDIAGGSTAMPQLMIRPALRWNPYSTPDPKIWICSSSTPPGAGVHGLCGYFAARAALRTTLGGPVTPGEPAEPQASR
jgi:phytoene dehydrogenase-like protein